MCESIRQRWGGSGGLAHARSLCVRCVTKLAALDCRACLRLPGRFLSLRLLSASRRAGARAEPGTTCKKSLGQPLCLSSTQTVNMKTLLLLAMTMAFGMSEP